MITQLIPDRLKTARENYGITMAEASRLINLSKIGYCRYEHGERKPSIQTLEIIARCLDTSVDYLTGKTDDMSPDQIIISKKSEPDLFLLVEKCRNVDSATLGKLLAYCQELSFPMRT